jgi:predicted RNA-binding protein with EMAP domain
MKLTEKERLMLAQKKEEILKLTLEILDNKNDPKQALEIKKKMTSVLSHISLLGSYAKSKNFDTGPLKIATDTIFQFMNMDMFKNNWDLLSPYLEIWCNTVNFIQFDFNKRDINIPKIDLSLFRIQ